jgi:hypothetical protein
MAPSTTPTASGSGSTGHRHPLPACRCWPPTEHQLSSEMLQRGGAANARIRRTFFHVAAGVTSANQRDRTPAPGSWRPRRRCKRRDPTASGVEREPSRQILPQAGTHADTIGLPLSRLCTIALTPRSASSARRPPPEIAAHPAAASMPNPYDRGSVRARIREPAPPEQSCAMGRISFWSQANSRVSGIVRMFSCIFSTSSMKCA